MRAARSAGPETRHDTPSEDPLTPSAASPTRSPRGRRPRPIPVPGRPTRGSAPSATESQSYFGAGLAAAAAVRSRDDRPVLVAMLLVVAVFADFFAPVNPNAPGVAFAPPDRITWNEPDGCSLTPVAYPITETDELDPVTFQPIVGPTTTTRGRSASSCRGGTTGCFGSSRPNRHFIGPADGTPAASPRHRQARARHLLARHRRLADLAHDRAHRRLHRHPGRHDWSASPRAISAGGSTSGCSASSRSSSPSRSCPSTWRCLADPGHRAVEGFLAFVVLVIVGARLGAAVARGARQDAGDGAASTTCARRWPSAPATGASSSSTSSRT